MSEVTLKKLPLLPLQRLVYRTLYLNVRCDVMVQTMSKAVVDEVSTEVGKRFFSFIEIEGTTIEERCRAFTQTTRKDNSWAFRNIINFLQAQKERVERKEITGSTIPKYPNIRNSYKSSFNNEIDGLVKNP